MGLFGDKLLLKLNATLTSSGKPSLQVEKADYNASHLLPFSCVSVLGSQLTVLTSYHPRSLSKKFLEFAENPRIQCEPVSLFSGFRLEIYQGDAQILYNQFNPRFSKTLLGLDNDKIETDIERTLQNYATTVYEDLTSEDKLNFQIFLLMTVACYQQEIIPIIKRINMYDLENRKRLARTIIDFTTSFYKSWDNPKTITPGNALFLEKIDEAKRFDSYLA